MIGSDTSGQDDLKRHAAEAALARVASGMTVGLGSGSTAALFIEALGRALVEGRLHDIRGIATSEASGALARGARIGLTDFSATPACDVVVDGADEIDPQLNLIKGLGGALMREKIVAQNSRRRVIIADAGKLVDRLGQKGPLPVEVAPFGHERHADFFRACGGDPELRRSGRGPAGASPGAWAQGEPYRTDNGNYIYDVRFGTIGDPRELEAHLMGHAGILCTGLFLGIADEVILARPEGVTTLTRA